jgi:secreted trypsin-like serine protease
VSRQFTQPVHGLNFVEIVPISMVMHNKKTLVAVVAFAACMFGVTGAVAQESNSPSFDELGDLTAVIGGQPSAGGTYPSTIAILRASNTQTLYERQFCGGTAISDYYVLTAAHCMFTGFSTLDADEIVIAGNFQSLDNDSPAEIPVAQIFIHPYYDNDDEFALHDVALLRTTVPHNVPVVPLFGGDARKLTDLTATVVGWGATQIDPQVIYPSDRYEADVPITDFTTCNNVYARGLGDEHLCAGFPQGGVDACQGDSGGPLYITDNNQTYQVGVTSFGDGCAQPNAYGVYANVEHYESWISRIVPDPSSGDTLYKTSNGLSNSASSSSSSGGGGLGAASHLGLLTLLGMVWHRRRENQGSLFRRLLYAGAVAGLMTGCATPFSSPVAIAGAPISAPANVLAKDTDMQEAKAIETPLTVTASEDYNGLPEFLSIALSAKRAEALATAIEQLGVEPACSGKKVAPKNSRRADYYERCEFSPISMAFKDGEVTSVTLHLMSARVVQIDANIQSAAVAVAPLSNSLDAMLGDSEFVSASIEGASTSSLPQAVYHWIEATQLAYARLQTRDGADGEAFQFSLQHPKFSGVIDELPALRP